MNNNDVSIIKKFLVFYNFFINYLLYSTNFHVLPQWFHKQTYNYFFLKTTAKKFRKAKLKIQLKQFIKLEKKLDISKSLVLPTE